MEKQEERYVIQLMWHLNDECNIKCRHCYAQGQGLLPIDRLDFQKKVIERIRELEEDYDIIRVGLLGGEPLLDPNLPRILELLRKNGVHRVDISSNGTLIDRKKAQELKNAGVKMVQISLEGASPEINDYVRGEGSFQKAMDGLRELKNAGVDTGIMSTISKFNLENMEALVELAATEKVGIISFNRMLPIGRGKDNSSSRLAPLAPEEIYRMIENVHIFDEKYKDMDVSSDDPLLYIPMNGKNFSDQAFGGCGAGVGNLAILHDGTVYPCRRLPIKIGNIIDSSLIQIINSNPLDCFYNRAEFLKGECNLCENRDICGGCRAAAYAFTGDYLQPDPQCWKIQKERR